MRKRIVIIGGGAAGFFAAINAAETDTSAEVTILEKTEKLLSKVKVSGGGRCNVTHACFENSRLVKNYPRGEKFLKKAFHEFNSSDTVNWFKKKGVALKEEADGRMFPVTDNSQTIINCFLQEVQRLKISVRTGFAVTRIEKDRNFFRVFSQNGAELVADKLLIAAGGNPKPEFFKWIQETGHTIEPPIPSLFTFNLPQHPLKELSGISMPDATVKIIGSKLEYKGPLLITHWGFSGPAILKLSAYGAKYLADLQYHFKIHVKWVSDFQEDTLREELYRVRELHSKKVIAANPLWNIPQRLWKKLLEFAEIEESLKWAELPKKNFNKFTENLIRAEFEVKGKTTFKEEFVTCGGVNLNEIDPLTMQSKICKGLFFAGEVMDVDGITGGFNFQHAWTSGYIAGKNMIMDT